MTNSINNAACGTFMLLSSSRQLGQLRHQLIQPVIEHLVIGVVIAHVALEHCCHQTGLSAESISGLALYHSLSPVIPIDDGSGAVEDYLSRTRQCGSGGVWK